MVWRRGWTALEARTSAKEGAEDTRARLEWIGEGVKTESNTRGANAEATVLKERHANEETAKGLEHLAARGAAGQSLGEVIEPMLVHEPHSFINQGGRLLASPYPVIIKFPKDVGILTRKRNQCSLRVHPESTAAAAIAHARWVVRSRAAVQSREGPASDFSACRRLTTVPFSRECLKKPYGVRRCRSRGKSVVSRTLLTPHRRATKRSTPSAKPPCGGMPCLKACR